MSYLVVAAAVAITQYRAPVERSADMLLWPDPDTEAELYDILSGQPADEMALVTGMKIPVPMFGPDSCIRVYAASIRDRGTGSMKVRAGRSTR